MSLLVLTQLEPLDPKYAWLAVYATAEPDPPDAPMRLLLLYSIVGLRPHEDDVEEALMSAGIAEPREIPPQHYANIAVIAQETHEMRGGYNMLVGESVADFPMTLTADDVAGLPHEEQRVPPLQSAPPH